MNLFSIDVERFAFDVFRIRWVDCKVPKKDVPFRPRVENGYSRNFIRSIAKYVMLYQELMRNNIELIMDLELVNVHDEGNMFEFFNNFMKIDKEVFKVQVMVNVACSLAICLELTLYKYPKHKNLLGIMPGKWKSYFRRYLQFDFYLNGGFEGLFEHAELMHANDYTMDKYIYDFKYGVNVLTILGKYNIKIDDKIRNSTFSVFNNDSVIFRFLHRFERLPIVGNWIRWTRKRFERIGSNLFRRISRQNVDFLDNPSENSSPRLSTRSRESVVDESAISSMIENYIKSVEEHHREEVNRLDFREAGIYRTRL